MKHKMKLLIDDVGLLEPDAWLWVIGLAAFAASVLIGLLNLL